MQRSEGRAFGHKCKGFEAKTNLMCLRNRKEARVAGM